MRQMGSFLTWRRTWRVRNALEWTDMVRFLPYDFEIKTMTDEKYGT